MSEREEIAHLLKGSRRFYSAYLHLLLGGKKIEDKWKQDLSVRDWLKGTHHLDAKGNGHRTCNSDSDCEVFCLLVGPVPVERWTLFFCNEYCRNYGYGSEIFWLQKITDFYKT